MWTILWRPIVGFFYEYGNKLNYAKTYLWEPKEHIMNLDPGKMFLMLLGIVWEHVSQFHERCAERTIVADMKRARRSDGSWKIYIESILFYSLLEQFLLNEYKNIWKEMLQALLSFTFFLMVVTTALFCRALVIFLSFTVLVSCSHWKHKTGRWCFAD